MIEHDDQLVRPGLLVSVRSAREAIAALEGGADVIDIKEPDRGALGAADAATIQSVVEAVNGKVPVTAAIGELIHLAPDAIPSVPRGVSLFKIGLAGCREISNWRSQWRDVIARLSCDGASTRRAASTAVAYADWRAAGAPEPGDVLEAAIEFGCPALLVDTFDKSNGALFDHWSADELADFVQRVQSSELFVVLAGSLRDEAFATAAALAPNLVAVRTAACIGGRQGAVASSLVQRLQAILATTPPHPGFSRWPKNFLDKASDFRILDSKFVGLIR